MKVLILAGGSGTRLWPLSRKRFPKQFIKLFENERSLFQKTFNRSLKLVSLDDIYILTNKDYKYLVQNQIDELGYNFNKDNILLEPKSKNTLPAIYYGVDIVTKKEEDNIVVFPSDHLIEDNHKFIEIIKSSTKLAKKYIITFGIKPNKPKTGYGYISPGEKTINGFFVKEFKEKPDRDTAKQFIESGYLWNSGIFMFNSNIFKNEVKEHAFNIYSIFQKYDDIKDVFKKIESISIDYGLLEKTSNITVVPVDLEWNDLGDFDSFYNVFQTDQDNNITDNKDILINSKNTLIKSNSPKIVAGINIKDLIVIDTDDALLICNKGSSQKVKDVVKILSKNDDQRINYHLEDQRPWGKYKVLEEKDTSKVKRITVLPGKRLSYQLHKYRKEHWYIVKGNAKVTIDDEIFNLKAGESVFIKEEQKHRVENNGDEILEFIEIQTGSYLEEDDIIRFDDDFDR